jgi:hypothetical protein
MRHSEDGTAHQAGVATYFGRMGSPTKTKSLNYDLRLFSRETRHRITMDMPQFVDGARKDRKLSPFQPDLTFGFVLINTARMYSHETIVCDVA